MKPLTETFRPRKLTDIRGQPNAVKVLSAKLRMKASFAAILCGEPGTGKTSAAYALAAELGCDVDGSEAQRISSGFWIVPSNRQGVDDLDQIFEHCRYRPMTGGNWWVVLLEESECKSRQAVNYLKTRLELLPKQTCVLFTTNSKLEDFADPAIAERCACLRFESQAERLWDEAQALVRHVWETSLGHNHCPSLEDLGFTKQGRLSFRQVVKAVEPLILDQLPPETDETTPTAAPEAICEVLPVSVAIEPESPPAATVAATAAIVEVEPVPEPEPEPVAPQWRPKAGERVRTVKGEVIRLIERAASGFWIGDDRHYHSPESLLPAEGVML
jgi:hypothetical protein